MEREGRPDRQALLGWLVGIFVWKVGVREHVWGRKEGRTEMREGGTGRQRKEGRKGLWSNHRIVNTPSELPFLGPQG